MDISKEILLSRSWNQKCNYEVFVDSKNEKLDYWNCHIIKDNNIYKFEAKKRDIINGTISIYRIEESIFIKSIHPQHCGDSIKILSKLENNNFECEFIKYPYKIIVKKGLIKAGEVNNPEIERIEFIKKIWPQNCGDSLRILEKIMEGENKGKWKCEFQKYPCIIYANKNAILKRNVFNPQINQINFVNKIWPQNCGGEIKIIKKSLQKGPDNSFLWECQFLGEKNIIVARKENIIGGKVLNKNIIWYYKENLERYIKETFNYKPTLRELSESLQISYVHIARKIKEFDLKHLVKCGEYKQNDILQILIKFFNKKDILDDYYFKDIQRELDFYIPSLNLGIEFNGNYWHSEVFKDSIWHQQKTLIFKEKGIRVIHIWEWELEQINNRLFVYLENIFNKQKVKIQARSCQIKELSYQEYAQFCNKNHLQGECGARVKLGLYYQNELVQIMSFGSPRFTSEYEWEIIRECSKENTLIIGGENKLFKYFINKYTPNNIITYCDFSKFTGESYLKLGFKFIRLNKPGFKWFDNKSKEVIDRSPWKHNELKHLFKIWDCGQLVFGWNK